MATQLDVYHLWLMNRARANPAGVAAELGIDLNEGLDPGTISADPKPPLILNSDLTTMAVAHSQDEIDYDFWSHTSPNTGTTQDRFDASPYDYIVYGENLSIIPTSSVIDDFVAAKTMFDALFIDAGVTGRGHRKSILNGTFRETGIGHLIGEWQGNTLTHMLTVTFGLAANAVNTVTGLLYEDSDSDGEYDVGEGISGITVDAEQNSSIVATTTTDANGYYALDLEFGTYDILARTTDHDATQEGVIVEDQNVLVDLLWDDTITTKPSGSFSSNLSIVCLDSDNPDVQALQPTNVEDPTPSEYTLSWDFTDATVVLLDGEVVSSTGSVTLPGLTSTVHTLKVIGPAGITTKTVEMAVSVFTPFNEVENELVEVTYDGLTWDELQSASLTTRTNSGMHPLYGPSPDQPLRVYGSSSGYSRSASSSGSIGPSKPEGALSVGLADAIYTRIAEVVRVAQKSRELDITFIDGSMPNTEIVRAEVAYGVYNEEGKINTPTPSAAIVGKGDRVVVLVCGQVYYVVSKLDCFDYPNNNRVAVYKENILYNLLGSFCVGAHFEEDATSWADFIDRETGLVVRIQCEEPNEETNRIPWRLLKRLAYTYLQNLNYVHVDDGGWPYERAGGGGLPTQPLYYNGTIRHKNTINNLPYVYDMPLGQTDYTGDLSIYSGVLTEVEKAKCHPLVADTINTYYDGATFIWFDDPDPEWVVVIGVFPTWDTTQVIKILEVPVYGWSEKAINDTEDEDIVSSRADQVEYVRHEDKVRELASITRSWIDWGTVDNDGAFSESYHRALSVPAKRAGFDFWKFAIHDGYGYSNGSVIYGYANEQKLLYGSISRHISGNLASNGSPYDYTINYDDPTYGSVDLWYDLTYEYYDDGAGDKHESQVTTDDIEEHTWTVYTNGIDHLYKKIHIDYYADGGYASYPWGTGGAWDGDDSYLGNTHNVFREYYYWNTTGNLVCTTEFDFWYTTGIHEFKVIQNIPVIHYANIEEGLFVIEKIKQENVNLLGPGANLTSGSRKREFSVWHKGTTYILFEVDMPYNIGTDKFPEIYNFWPWEMDANTPLPPETPPYNQSEEFSSVFFIPPFAAYYVAPISPYSFSAVGYPTMQGDVSSILFAAARNDSVEDLKPEYMQIYFDPKTKSWGVTLKNVIEIYGTRSISFPDGGGDTTTWVHGTNTLFKIGSGSPSFTKPSVSRTIDL